MKRTTIMAEENLLYKIEQIARESGRSKAEVIREALADYVAKIEQDAPPKHPLLTLIGLAADDATPMDLADGQDEQLLWGADNESDR